MSLRAASLALVAASLGALLPGFAALQGRGDGAPQAPGAPGAPNTGGAPGDRARPAPGRGAPPAEPAPSGQGGEDAAEDTAAAYFAICDYNADGWVSFKEAVPALGVDRSGFAGFDLDVDGRIGPEEFARRYALVLEQGGSFPPPIAQAKPRTPGPKTPVELLEAYDSNADAAIDEREIARVLTAYLIADLAPAAAIANLDRDATGKLEEAELPALASVLEPDLGPRTSTPKVGSIEELFGKVKERKVGPGSTPLPPQIVGPVPAFRRLDLDGDGRISMSDLTDLQRPIQMSVRVNALMATLDVDGDGTIDQDEFWSSMRAPAR